MKYKQKKWVIWLFPVTIVGAFIATLFADKGTYHYGPFILAPLVIYDGMKSWHDKNLLALIQIAFGGFLLAEHVYLVQVFWQGVIMF